MHRLHKQVWQPGTERKACIKALLCHQGHAILKFMKSIQNLLKIVGMKFEFQKLEIRFHKRQVSFLYKRNAISCIRIWINCSQVKN